MKPEFQYHLKRNYYLRVVICFLVVLLLIFGSYSLKKKAETRSLKASLELLESSFEQQKARNQLQFDSLQKLIQHQDSLHFRLKDSLSILRNQRLQLKKRSNENKAAIHRLHDVDSLRNVVARHYRC